MLECPSQTRRGSALRRNDPAVTRALLIGLAAPTVAAGAVSALLLAATSPPLVALTGLGRWHVFPAFSAAGLALSLWLVAGPTTAALYAAGRALTPGRAPGWGLAAGAAALAGGGLAAITAAHLAGGPGAPGFRAELWDWSGIWGLSATGAAVWLHLSVRAALRRQKRTEER